MTCNNVWRIFVRKPLHFMLLTALGACASTEPPSAVEIGNAAVSGIFDDAIHLQDGRWEGDPYVAGAASRPSAGIMDEVYLTGDLNGDGDDEAVMTLWSSSGGSGTLLYVAVFASRASGVANLDTVLVGDRVRIRAASMSEKQIVLDVVQQGPGDAACCPRDLATRRWRMADGRLQELPIEITGRLSTDG